MKVILCDNVDDLGKKGDVVEVEDSLAKYHLFPKGIAVEATLGNLKTLEKMTDSFDPDALSHPPEFIPDRRKSWMETEQTKTSNVQRIAKLASRLNGIEVTINYDSLKEVNGGTAVTAEVISRSLKDQTGFQIAPNRFELNGNLTEPGLYTVGVRLDSDMMAYINVLLESEELEETNRERDSAYLRHRSSELDEYNNELSDLEDRAQDFQADLKAAVETRIEKLQEQSKNLREKLRTLQETKKGELSKEERKNLRQNLQRSWDSFKNKIRDLRSRFKNKNNS